MCSIIRYKSVYFIYVGICRALFTTRWDDCTFSHQNNTGIALCSWPVTGVNYLLRNGAIFGCRLSCGEVRGVGRGLVCKPVLMNKTDVTWAVRCTYIILGLCYPGFSIGSTWTLWFTCQTDRKTATWVNTWGHWLWPWDTMYAILHPINSMAGYCQST